ncbi:MAG TPA: protein kinase [Actinoallomurus sp.]
MDTPRLLKHRYRLGKVIGRGGMGVVWLATDEVLDRRVAVKEVTFPPGLAHEEQETLRRRTLREARTNARLNHPNVVGVFDIVEDEDRPWIVMEYVPSRSLAETVRADGPFTPRRTAEIGLQLLSGLRAAHSAGVLHRDVKPSNVLLAENGRVVLGDFGIATAKGGSTVTSSGVLIGSPSYMAPERARGHKAGPESDLWSLGATLYTAVEGRPPFDRDSAVATLAALVMDEPDEPDRAGPLWPMIRGLLQRDPGQRPTADAVADTLREIAATPAEAPPDERSPVESAAEAPPAPSVPRPRRAPDASPVLDAPADEPVALDDATPASARRETAEAVEPEVVEPGPEADPEAGGAVSVDDATGHSGLAGMETIRTDKTGRRRSRRSLAGLLTGAVVVVAALLAWTTTSLFNDDGAHRRSRQAAPAPGGSTPRPSASASAASSPPASPPVSPTTTTLPSGYHWHHDSTHFSIAVPNGWSASHHGHYLYVEDPHSSRILIVDQSDTPKSDPLADWKEQEAARRGGFSGYHRVRLESVDYPQARKAADWEFTYNGSSGRTHVLNRNILANKKHAYALYWQVPDSRWKSSRGIFDVFASSFRPATG